MLRDALYLAGKDLRFLFRDRSTWIWAFVMPVVFFYFIGTMTGGYSRPATRPSIALLAAPDSGYMTDLLASRLEDRGFRVVRVETPQEAARYARRLSVPAGFTENVLSGNPMKLSLARAGDGLDASYDQFRVGRAVYSLLADLIVTSTAGKAVSPEALEEIRKRPRLITVDVTTAGKRTYPPGGFEQSVPGTMVMFVLLTMLTTGAVWLVIERKQGILRRLASSPVSRSSIVLGKGMARMALGSVQIGFAMIAGSVLFRVQWGPNLWFILVMLGAYAALAVAASVLLGALAHTEGQAIGIGVLLTNLLGALGGCWWPIEVAPRWAQKFAMLLPTGWAMDALHKLVSFGDSPQAALPHLVALAAGALVLGAIAVRRFRFE
ncbi:MAG: ABC transporter permease [Bryobacteraceae bacterium]